MNHLIALQRKSDGRWDYTMNGVPVGYCREWHDWDFLNATLHPSAYEQAESFKHKHHANGHENPEQASECYKEYLLDQRLSLNHHSASSQHRCVVCKEWTDKFAQVGTYEIYFLCDKHHNREEVAKLFAIGEAWES